MKVEIYRDFVLVKNSNANHTDWSLRLRTTTVTELLKYCKQLICNAISSGKPIDVNKVPSLNDIFMFKNTSSDSLTNSEEVIQKEPLHNKQKEELIKAVVKRIGNNDKSFFPIKNKETP